MSLDYDWSPYYSTEVERCGLILRSGEIVEIENSASAPEFEFEMADEAIAPYKDSMIATWHTHTEDNPNLSLDDYLTFTRLKDLNHFIISQRRVVEFGTVNNFLVILGDRIL